MKKGVFFYTICVLVMNCCMIGCSQDDSEWSVPSDEEKMLGIVYSKYIILENDRYVLNLSKEDALESGISESCYAKVLADLEKSNAFIVKAIGHAKTDPNATIVFSNPSGADYSIQFLNGERAITYQDKLAVTNIRLKNGSEGDGWSFVTEADLELGCTPSRNSASGTLSQGTTKAKFTFKGPKNIVGTLTLTVNSTDYTMTSYSGGTSEKEVNISSSRNWKVTLTDGNTGKVKVYKK
jgi:hypothetical protein